MFTACKKASGGEAPEIKPVPAGVKHDAIGDNYQQDAHGEIPTAANHKRNIMPADLDQTEWLREISQDDGTKLYEYMKFSKDELPDMGYRVAAYGKGATLAAAKATAEHAFTRVTTAIESGGQEGDLMYMEGDFPDLTAYGMPWTIQNGEIVSVLASGETFGFWMNDSVQIVAQYDSADNEVTKVFVKQ